MSTAVSRVNLRIRESENSAFDQQNSIFKNTVFPGKYRFSGILGVLVCRVKKYSVPCLHICEKHRTNTSKTRQNIQFLALILGNLSMAKKCVPHFFFTSSFFLLKDLWIHIYINQTSSKCKFLFSRNTTFS